jgi:hypothetical protein
VINFWRRRIVELTKLIEQLECGEVKPPQWSSIRSEVFYYQQMIEVHKSLLDRYGG